VHPALGGESETENYEMLQNITNNKLCIPDSNMQRKQSDEIAPNTCFADIDFQTILSEVEIMEKSALDISYSADKGYERLRNMETNITIPEEDFKEETLVMSAEEASEISFSDIQTIGTLSWEGKEMDQEIHNNGLQMLESEKVERAASEGPHVHGSHNEEIRIDLDLDSEDHYDSIAA
jgi:hypothetical protein